MELCDEEHKIISDQEIRKPINFGTNPADIEIDEINRKILHYIAIDARIPVIEIAKKLQISADAVAIRIKKLERSQIIHNYSILPNLTLLNQISYKVLFSLHNLTKEGEKSFFQYCKTQPHIWFHSESLGRWDLEINMDIDNPKQFRGIMMDIKEKFSDIIKNYITLQVSIVHKFNFYPFKV